jgi:predicted RNA binding protein YcfA (HicA-like mRNA interferase family)
MRYHHPMDREELRRRIAQHPRTVTFDELRRLLEAYGWELARVRGSHHIFRLGTSTITVPHRRPTVLPTYVRQILAITESLGTMGTQEEEETDDDEEQNADSANN